MRVRFHQTMPSPMKITAVLRIQNTSQRRRQTAAVPNRADLKALTVLDFQPLSPYRAKPKKKTVFKLAGRTRQRLDGIMLTGESVKTQKPNSSCHHLENYIAEAPYSARKFFYGNHLRCRRFHVSLAN